MEMAQKSENVTDLTQDNEAFPTKVTLIYSSKCIVICIQLNVSYSSSLNKSNDVKYL